MGKRKANWRPGHKIERKNGEKGKNAHKRVFKEGGQHV